MNHITHGLKKKRRRKEGVKVMRCLLRSSYQEALAEHFCQMATWTSFKILTQTWLSPFICAVTERLREQTSTAGDSGFGPSLPLHPHPNSSLGNQFPSPSAESKFIGRTVSVLPTNRVEIRESKQRFGAWRSIPACAQTGTLVSHHKNHQVAESIHIQSVGDLLALINKLIDAVTFTLHL